MYGLFQNSICASSEGGLAVDQTGFEHVFEKVLYWWQRRTDLMELSFKVPRPHLPTRLPPPATTNFLLPRTTHSPTVQHTTHTQHTHTQHTQHTHTPNASLFHVRTHTCPAAGQGGEGLPLVHPICRRHLALVQGHAPAAVPMYTNPPPPPLPPAMGSTRRRKLPPPPASTHTYIYIYIRKIFV
jgi:hypothetical protein